MVFLEQQKGLTGVLTYETENDKNGFIQAYILQPQALCVFHFLGSNYYLLPRSPHHVDLNSALLNPFVIVSNIDVDSIHIAQFLYDLGVEEDPLVVEAIKITYQAFEYKSNFLLVADYLSNKAGEKAKTASFQIYHLFASISRFERANTSNCLEGVEEDIAFDYSDIDSSELPFMLKLAMLNSLLYLGFCRLNIRKTLVLDDLHNYVQIKDNIDYINKISKYIKKQHDILFFVIYNPFFEKQYSLNYSNLLELADFKIYFKQTIDYNFSSYQRYGFHLVEPYKVVNGIIELELGQFILIKRGEGSVVTYKG